MNYKEKYLFLIKIILSFIDIKSIFLSSLALIQQVSTMFD